MEADNFQELNQHSKDSPFRASVTSPDFSRAPKRATLKLVDLTMS